MGGGRLTAWRWALRGACVALVVAPVTADAATSTAVSIQDFQFQPATITIEPGDTVVWTNLDFTAHNVTGDGFVSGNLGNGAQFAHDFTDVGTFAYLCTLHSGMTGTVEVAAAPLPEIPDATMPVLFGLSAAIAGVGAWSLWRRSSGERRPA